MHGTEFDPLGDMMRLGHKDRILTSGGVEIPWPKICDPDPGNEQVHFGCSTDARACFAMRRPISVPTTAEVR